MDVLFTAMTPFDTLTTQKKIAFVKFLIIAIADLAASLCMSMIQLKNAVSLLRPFMGRLSPRGGTGRAVVKARKGGGEKSV